MTGTLTAGIGAGLAGALPSAAFAADAAAAPAAGAGMKLGMVTYKMGEKMSVDELIDLCKKAGLAGVELRTTHAHKVEPNLSKQERADVKKKFADGGVVIAGLGTTCEFHAKDDKYLLGQGRIDFQKVRRAMDDIGYRGWIQIEAAAPHSLVEDYRTDLKFLKGIFPA